MMRTFKGTKPVGEIALDSISTLRINVSPSRE